MPQTCRACASSKRKEIDKALAVGEPLRNIAKRHGISPASLVRHKSHVAGAIQRAAERREESIGETVLARLERLYKRAQVILSDAEKSRNGKLALASIKELRELLAGVYSLAKDGGSGVSREPLVFRVIYEDPQAAVLEADFAGELPPASAIPSEG